MSAVVGIDDLEKSQEELITLIKDKSNDLRKVLGRIEGDVGTAFIRLDELNRLVNYLKIKQQDCECKKK